MTSLWMGFHYLKATRATTRRQFTFYHYISRNSWYIFDWPQRDERLSRSQRHPVILNTGPLNWESSTLTTMPLLHIQVELSYLISLLFLEPAAVAVCFYSMIPLVSMLSAIPRDLRESVQVLWCSESCVILFR